MRKTPIYQIKDDLSTWLSENSDLIFDEILESAEEAAQRGKTFSAVPVIILETPEGTTLFTLKSSESVSDGLDKAMKNFIDREAYEKAARVRDLQETLQGSRFQD